jgi:hypothetical protein
VGWAVRAHRQPGVQHPEPRSCSVHGSQISIVPRRGDGEIADALPFHCIPDRARFHLGGAQCPQKADDFLGTLKSPSLGIVDHDAGLGQGPGWLGFGNRSTGPVHRRALDPRGRARFGCWFGYRCWCWCGFDGSSRQMPPDLLCRWKTSFALLRICLCCHKADHRGHSHQPSIQTSSPLRHSPASISLNTHLATVIRQAGDAFWSRPGVAGHDDTPIFPCFHPPDRHARHSAPA